MVRDRRQLRQEHPEGGEVTVADEKKTYESTTAYLTKEQMDWLRGQVGKALVGGSRINNAAIMRLALDRLIAEVAAGLDLVPALADHALLEAQTYTGRAKSGMPQRPADTANTEQGDSS